jgi:type I restriction enzyme R subunit
MGRSGHFAIPDVLEVPPISAHGNLKEVATKFGEMQELVNAIEKLQKLLYAA